jgi:cysteine desulfurase
MALLGFDLLELPVDADGVVRMDELVQLLSPETRLVSIMAANNETGVLQPIAEIGRVVRSICPSALFHTDATQAIGKIGIDLQGEWADVDLLSFSAHKFHGPKGVGGVYWRPGIELSPLLVGGGQEDGFRSGTTNTPGLAGLAAAASEIDITAKREVSEKRDYFERRLSEVLPVQIHSAGAPRLPNTSCFSIVGMSGDELASELAELGIIVGTGSACSSGSLAPSTTLAAMGVDYDVAMGTLRVSLSQSTLVEELDTLINTITEIRS